MFKLKNELTLTQSYILSKKEKKDFMKLLKSSYDQEAVEYIFNSFDKISISKISLENSKKRIMSYENNPILFEYANEIFYPTVYLLNMFPDLMNRRAIIYEETDSYLANGADLMLKGVLNREEIKKKGMFKLGDPFYVQTISGVITSIGVTMVSSTTLNIHNPSGKFLKIVHRLDDALWFLGNKKIPVPDPNFKKTRKIDESNNLNVLSEIFKENKNFNLNENENLEWNQENTAIIFSGNEDEKKKTLNNLIQTFNINPEIINQSEMQNLIESFQIKINQQILIEDSENKNEENKQNLNNAEAYASNENLNNKIIENEINSEEISSQVTETGKFPNEEEISIITPENMDENIKIIFATLLKLHFFHMRDSGIFPLDPGKLYKDFMKPLSNEMRIPLDFKFSSFKKINNFLKFQQIEINLLTFGKPKGIQNDFILSVLWDHPFIKDFNPPIKKIKFLTEKENSDSNSEKENVILQKDEKIEILQKFKPNQKIKSFFHLIDREFDEKSYYHLKYCNEVLINYLKEKNLMMKDSQVKLNQELEDSLFKKKQNVFQPDERVVKMEEILQRWKENLNEKSFITKTNSSNESELITNNQFKVKIFAKKLHNKNVTIVEGLQNFINVKDVIKTFSKHFACSVTLKDFQEFKDAIFIQGYWVTELQNILQDEIKLNKKFIQVDDKLKLKKK